MNLTQSRRKRHFKRKQTQTCIESSLGISQLLLNKNELEIYFHHFEEFFKTLKFQIKQKSDFQISVEFSKQKKDSLLDIKFPIASQKNSIYQKIEDTNRHDQSRNSSQLFGTLASIDDLSQKDSFKDSLAREITGNNKQLVIGSDPCLAFSPICNLEIRILLMIFINF